MSQIFEFTNDGKKLLLTIGEKNVEKSDQTHFGKQSDMAFLPDGSFYVSDGYINSRVAYFDASGKELYEWGKKGSGEGEFSNPHGLSFVNDSTDVLVADRENSRLQLFDNKGKFKRQWTGVKDTVTTGRIFSVATDAAGALYLGIRRADYDTQHTGVVKLDHDWNIVMSVGFGIPGDPVFNAVHDIAVAPDGTIYVADSGNDRIARYDAGVELHRVVRSAAVRGLPGGASELQTAQLVIGALHPLVTAFRTGAPLTARRENVENLNYLQCSWAHAAIYSNRKDFAFARRVFRENPQYKSVPKTSLIEKNVLVPDMRE